MNCDIYFKDGTALTRNIDFMITSEKNTVNFVLTEELDYEKITKIDVRLYSEEISTGDEGFYFMPYGYGKCTDYGIGYFRKREDMAFVNLNPHMPVFGLTHKGKCFFCIVTGMSGDAYPKMVVKNGKYSFYMQFAIDCRKPYESIAFEMHELVGKDMTYSGMAREYRRYQLAHGFIPIKKRLNKHLKYAAESLLVRVRMGWKPVPCTVDEQTTENEPPMHVACTFADVERLMRAYKLAGVEKADFSLVGWNIKGHDGRWPQILPVEESLGGEAGLRSLIKKAKEYGYALTCHTNSTDAYSIADNFDRDDLIVKSDGETSVLCTHWSGGRTYNICPEKALKLAHETLPAVRELGFEGIHYIDVVTAVKLRNCFHKEHPVTKRQCAEYWNELFAYAKELFGGISSECSFDHTLKNCDYVLYVSFNKSYMKPANSDVLDEFVPFWQLVYHGIVLSNPYSKTVNAIAAGDRIALLKSIEYGARPTLYYYSQFVNDGSNWISENDLTIDTPEKFSEGVRYAKEEYDIFKNLSYLQYEFMENHEKTAEGVYRVTYSDGSVVTVDYNNGTYELKRGS